MDGAVGHILDLTDKRCLAALGTTEDEVLGAWVKAARPPTQWLAQLAFDSGRIAGIKYRSTKHPGGLNLVVFPERLATGPSNYLEAYDPTETWRNGLGVVCNLSRREPVIRSTAHPITRCAHLTKTHET